MAEQVVREIRDIPEFLREPYERLIGSAEALTAEDYPLYTGSRIAPFSGLQNQAFGLAPNIPTTGLRQLGLSEAAALQGAQGVPDIDISAYMNPFMEAAIQPALQDIERTHLKELNRMGAQAAASGAFGGSRQALLESEQGRNFMEARGDLMAKGLAAAYESGLQAFGEDQSRRLAASQQLGALGEAEQAIGLRGIDTLMRSGALQQGQTQAGLDIAYGDFLEERDWPYGQLSFMQAMLAGGPQIGTLQSTTDTGGGNRTAQILGGATVGLGLADTLFDVGGKFFGGLGGLFGG